MPTASLDLADYVLIAEAVLGVGAEEIARSPGILYPDVVDKAAVPCVRLAGSKRVSRESRTMLGGTLSRERGQM